MTASANYRDIAEPLAKHVQDLRIGVCFSGVRTALPSSCYVSLIFSPRLVSLEALSASATSPVKSTL